MIVHLMADKQTQLPAQSKGETVSNKVTIYADRPSSKWFKPTLYECKTTERGRALGAGVAVPAAYEESGLLELEDANFGSGVELAAGAAGEAAALLLGCQQHGEAMVG